MRLPLVLLLLAGCDRAPSAQGEARTQPAVRAGCALDGADAFADCTVQRTSRERETTLTLIAPDGGFRRLAVAADGAGITAADGAEPARVGTGPAGEVEITIARDRYRLPAARP